MALQVRHVGVCDHEGCTAEQAASGMVYAALQTAGWQVVLSPAGRARTVSALYCPEHRTDTA